MATAQISKQQIISALKQIQEEIKTTDEKLKDTSFFHALECLRMALVTEKTARNGVSCLVPLRNTKNSIHLTMANTTTN